MASEHNPSSQDAEIEQKKFYVTRESQQSQGSVHRKFSYTGIRDLTDIERIQEEDITEPDGSLLGIKNRVRAGRAHFENPTALSKIKEEEGRVIVYVTSFRGVRSINDECRYVLSVLHNFRVKVEERDIYVHKYYYNELEERLGLESKESMSIPQIFINGQHVGGADQLEALNETGELRSLLSEVPRMEVTMSCRTCGGYKFIPCDKCGGSKNSVANNFTAEFRALKCTHCNENGLVHCQDCSQTQEEIEQAKEEKRQKEQQEKELFEKIQKEKLEAELKKQLEAEKAAKAEKERKEREKKLRKERARQERERKARVAEARRKVAADIAQELEREKEWQMQQFGPGDKDEDKLVEQHSSTEDVESMSRDDQLTNLEHDTASDNKATTDKHTDEMGGKEEVIMDKNTEDEDGQDKGLTNQVTETEVPNEEGEGLNEIYTEGGSTQACNDALDIDSEANEP